MSDQSQVTASWSFAMLPDVVLFADVSPLAVRLFAALHKYSTMPNGAVPGRKTLAEEIHSSESAIDRALIELKDRGFVSVTRRWKIGDQIIEGGERPEGASASSNRYHLLPGWTQDRVQGVPVNGYRGVPEIGQRSENESEREGSDQLTTRTRENPRGPQIKAAVEKHETDQKRVQAIRDRLHVAMKRRGNASQKSRLAALVRLGITDEDVDYAIEITGEEVRDDSIAYALGVLKQCVERRDRGENPHERRSQKAGGGNRGRVLHRGGARRAGSARGVTRTDDRGGSRPAPARPAEAPLIPRAVPIDA